MSTHFGFRLQYLAAALILLASINATFADDAPAPAPKPAIAPPSLNVTVDAKAAETHIQISRKALAKMLETQTSPEKNTVGIFSNPDHTIIAGLAMSLALVLGGLYLARKRGGKAVLSPLAMLAIIGVLCGGSVAFADRAPPESPADARPKIRPANSTLNAVDGDVAELTISQGMLRQLKKKAAAK